MTCETFLLAFQQAVIVTKAQVFTDVPTAYPHGERIRLKVIPSYRTGYRERSSGYAIGGGLCLPRSLDPLQTVWYARTGEISSVIEYLTLGRDLGLSDAASEALARASDHAIETLTEPERIWRLGLLYVVDGLLLSPPVRG